MTLKEFFKVLDDEYPYLEYGAVEEHSVEQGILFGHHVIQVKLIVRTGLLLEYDETKKMNNTVKPKKEGSRCGIAGKNKGKDKGDVQQRDEHSTNDVGKTE